MLLMILAARTRKTPPRGGEAARQLAIVENSRTFAFRLTYLCWQTTAAECRILDATWSGHALMLIIEASDNLSDFSLDNKTNGGAAKTITGTNTES